MAKLYFRYGVMGSSKSANALMVRYNYEERGQRAPMGKPALDRREGKGGGWPTPHGAIIPRKIFKRMQPF